MCVSVVGRLAFCDTFDPLDLVVDIILNLFKSYEPNIFYVLFLKSEDFLLNFKTARIFLLELMMLVLSYVSL